MRNLYKYTRLYSHAEPFLSEGDVFEIRIPLVKSDIEFENPDIATGKSDIAIGKSDIAIGKSDIDARKTEIENRKLSLDALMQKCRSQSYKNGVVENIKKIYISTDTDQIFGESDVEIVLGCARSTAADIMKGNL